MADFVERLILDDSGFINPLEKSLKKIKETQKGFEELNEGVKEQSGEMGNQIVDTNKKVTKAQDETIKSTRLQTDEFKKQVSETKVLGISINDVKEKLNGYINTLKGGLASITSFAKLSKLQEQSINDLTKTLGGGRGAFVALAKGVNIFKAALVATGIGALVVGLGSLVAFLTSTQKGMDLVNRATTAIGTVFTKVTDIAANFGEKIFKAFENPKQAIKDFGQIILDNVINRFKGVIDTFGAAARVIGNIVVGNFSDAGKAAKDFQTGLIQVASGLDETQQQAAKDGIKNFIKDVTNTVSEVDKLTVALINNRRKQAENNIEFAKQRAEVEELKKVSDDYTKTFSERTEATRKGGAIEIAAAQKKAALIKEEIGLLQAIAKSRGNNDLDSTKVEIQQKQLEYYDLMNDSTGKQTELQNMLNGLLKEQQDYLITATEKLMQMGREWNLITEQEEFEFVKEKQVKELDEYIKKLKDIGGNLEVDINPVIKIAEKGKEQLLAREFSAILEPLSKEIKPLEIPIKPKVEIGKVNVDFEVEPESILEGIENFEDLLDSTLEEIFGKLDGADAKEFLIGAYSLVSEFGNIAAEATQIAISNIDKQLDRLGERRSELESELDYELQLQAEGRANNVGDKQKEVDGIIAEEARMIAEKEKLQAKAQRQQLLFDTAQQTASLITSSINIIKGFSNIPIVGLPLGIAAVGALAAFFAKTKVDAFKATRLYDGADRVNDHFGFSDRYGDTDLPGRGNGYRVVSSRTGKDTGVIISGREMILPEKYSIPNEDFFTNLRLGRYDGIDLDSAVRFSQEFKGSKSLNTKTIEKNIIQSQKQQKQRVLLQVGPKKYTVVTINDNMRDGQIIEIDI